MKLINKIYTTRLNLQREVAVLGLSVWLRAIKFGTYTWPQVSTGPRRAPKGASKTIFPSYDLKAWFIANGPYKWMTRC